MPAFSPEFSKIFKIASFSNLVSALPIVILRVILIVTFGALITLSISNDNLKMTYLWSALILACLMFEVFYRLKVLDSKPTKTITDNYATDNIAESIELPTAKILSAILSVA